MNKFISLIIVTLSFIFVLVTEIKASDICEKEEKYSQAWYYNNCDGNILQSTDQKPIKSHLKQNPNVGYPYNSDEIPQDANPDYKILKQAQDYCSNLLGLQRLQFYDFPKDHYYL